MSRESKEREKQEAAQFRRELEAKKSQEFRRTSSPYLSLELPAELPEGVTPEQAGELLTVMKGDNGPNRIVAMTKLCELGVFNADQLDTLTGYQAPDPPPVVEPSPKAARQRLKVVHAESPPADHNHEAETIVIAAAILRPKLRPRILAASPPESFFGAAQKKLIRLVAERQDQDKPIDAAVLRDLLTRDGPALDVGALTLLDQAVKRKLPSDETVLEFAANVLLRSKERECERLRKELAAVMLDGSVDAARLQQVSGELLKQLDVATPNDWPAPILDDKIPPVAFPLDVIPTPMADLAGEVSQLICTPVETFLLPALTFAGTMIGNSVGIELKRRWIESPLLWTAYVVPPGHGKTAALEQAKAPLMTIFQRLTKEYKELLDNTPEAKKAALDPLQRLIVNDITWEGLAKILAGNPAVTMYQDEISAWLLGMNQFKSGGGNDEENWMSSWSGMSIVVDRKGQDGQIPIIVHRPFASISGGIQPGKLFLLRKFTETRDGFLDRLLVSYPETVPQKWFDATVSDDAYRRYERMIRRLWERPTYKGDDGEPRMEVVRFTAEAKDRWVEWYDAICDEIDAPDFPEHLHGAWSKCRIYCGRFALLLELLGLAYEPRWNGKTRDVGLAALEGAIELVAYFQAHYRRVYAAIKGEKDHNAGACAVLAWVLKSGRRRFTETEARDNFRRSMGDDPDALPRAIEWLKARRCLRVANTSARVLYKQGRKPSLLYEVNPYLFENGVCARFIRKS